MYNSIGTGVFMLTVTKQKFNSVLVSSDSQDELGQTFMRFQEYYECPNSQFRNNIFTRGQYLDWYSKTYGAATYHIDWTGFNFPSYILEPFKNGLFDPLTKEELALLSLFKYRTDKFYIIGANDDSTIRHELAHALYYHDKTYSDSINTLFDNNIEHLKKASKYILDKGYTGEVLYDELQAYITDNDNEYLIKTIPSNIIDDVNSIYQKHSLDKSESGDIIQA